MSILVAILLAVTLLLAPIFAAQPDAPAAVGSFEWTSFLCAGTFLAALTAALSARRGGQFAVSFSRAEKAFLVLLGLALLSIPARMLVQHGAGYFGVMLRGWSLLAADFALFALARRVAGNRHWLYSLVFAAVAGAAIVADIGVQEYIVHLRAGERGWRIFATSTPDFLAGYFVLTLPVTLGLFLTVPSVRGLTPLLRGASALVLGVVFLLQLIALLVTGSRFGLLSLAVSLVVFALGVVWSVRHGLVLPKATRGLLGVLGVGLALGGIGFAGPVVARLHNLHDNSAAFRIWTWRGSGQMALHNPLLGTGVGTWVDLYPPYALTGFTRLAHNGYLQMADECGLPALMVLIAALGLLGAVLWRGLSRPSETVSETGSDALPADNRLLLSGLAAAMAGGIVQNLIDSDWYVFYLGAVFWTLAGLAAGAVQAESQAQTRPIPALVRAAAGLAAAALCALTGTQGTAAGYAAAASEQKAADPGGAAQSLGAARIWDPLNGRYASDLGYGILYSRLGDLTSAEAALSDALRLEPNSVNYRHLGTVLQAAGRRADAVQAYKDGLRAEPNSVELLLRLARLSAGPESQAYYRKIADLEQSPVGTARALGESVEPSFAYADAALGKYERAATLLETYITQGGSLNSQREALSGGRPDPQMDTQLRALYVQTMDGWIDVSLPAQRRALQARQKEFTLKFDIVIGQASKPGIL